MGLWEILGSSPYENGILIMINSSKKIIMTLDDGFVKSLLITILTN